MKKGLILSLILGSLMITSCENFQFGFSLGQKSSTSNSTISNSDVSNDSTTSNSSSSNINHSSNITTNITSSTKEDLTKEYRRLEINETIQALDYVEGALPASGKPKALVVPVDFSDCTAESKGYSIDLIEKAFNGNSEDMEWESVNSFFKKSSYGRVDVEFDVRDSWFRASRQSSYYASYKDPSGVSDPAELIIKEYLTQNPDKLDFSDYDTNGDQYIDSIYLIYSHAVNYQNTDTIWWAYQYYYMSDDFFDGVTPYYYVFAGYEFLLEDDMNCNTHTFIHESGHLFGLEDYYDYDDNSGTSNGGLAGADIMDYTVGDHNAFSKMLLGWANPILITTQDSVTIDLASFQDNGDCVILANDWKDSSGLYQEYFVVEYWTPTGLNEFDSTTQYLYSAAGIRVIHVSATLTNKDGYTYFQNDNSYTNIKLATLVPANNARITSSSRASNAYLYRPNNNPTFSGAKYNNRTALNYEFTVNSLSDTHANITFTKVN